MILVDTNVLIDYFNGSDLIIDSLSDTEDIATCGIILAELFHGVKSKNEKTEISEALADFQWISIPENLWWEVGDNLNLMKKKGLTVPFQDAIIATLSIQNDLYLLTKDKHFSEIAKILPLKLYKQ